MSIVLWVITALALVIGSAAVLLVIHGARQAEIHEQERRLRAVKESPVSKENES